MNFEAFSSTLDEVCILGDLYEKRRRLKDLKESLDMALVGTMSHEGDLMRERIQSELDRLPEPCLADAPADSALVEGVGETLDALFTGLCIGSENAVDAKDVKLVEVKPGRQYRKVIRTHAKNTEGADGQNRPKIVIRKQSVVPHAVDATSADENESQEPASAPSAKEMSDVPSEDEEARRGYGHPERGNRTNDIKSERVLEIPIRGNVLAQAAATRRADSSSSGGSTRAVGGKSCEQWHRRGEAEYRNMVPAEKLGPAQTIGEDDRRSSTSSDGSITSPAVVFDRCGFRS
jgi:hypothetical protein